MPFRKSKFTLGQKYTEIKRGSHGVNHLPANLRSKGLVQQTPGTDRTIQFTGCSIHGSMGTSQGGQRQFGSQNKLDPTSICMYEKKSIESPRRSPRKTPREISPKSKDNIPNLSAVKDSEFTQSEGKRSPESSPMRDSRNSTNKKQVLAVQNCFSLNIERIPFQKPSCRTPIDS